MTLLGAMHADGLPVDLFTSGEAHWLGIQVGTQPEQQPRVLLVSVPYALKAGDAETLGGKPASAFVQVESSGNASDTKSANTSSPSSGSTSKRKANSTTPTPNVAGTGTTNFLTKWTDASGTLGNSQIFDNGSMVGIGTSSPQTNLHLLSPSDAIFRITAPYANQSTLSFADAWNSPGTDDFKIYRVPGTRDLAISTTAAGEVMRIKQNGFVGIGTSAPLQRLHLYDGANSVNFRITAPLSKQSAISFADTTNDQDFAMYRYPGTRDVSFFTPTAGDFVRFTQTGNVGIGTTVPAARLEVNGTGKFDSSVGIYSPATAGSPPAALTVKATDTNTPNFGIYSTSSGAGGTGVYGEADNGTLAVGVWGSSSSGLAGLFSGDVQISGSISKAGGSFKIDDPVDPANKYLYHSFVESPDMMNIYDGVVTLDAKGEASVTLPAWFEALNREFRYQLTCVGGYSQIYISQKIQNNTFKIAGGTPGLEVDWQVTGIRHDAWANAHRIPVEVDKPSGEQGYFLHPELFGAPRDKNVIVRDRELLKKSRNQ